MSFSSVSALMMRAIRMRRLRKSVADVHFSIASALSHGASASTTSVNISTPATASDIPAILDLLEAEGPKSEDDSLLKQLHLFTRTTKPTELAPLLSERAVNVISKIAFVKGKATERRRAAIRCLNNILVLEPALRRYFAEKGHAQGVIDVLSEGNNEDELPCASLMMFSSVGTGLDLNEELEKGKLVDAINKSITRHAKASRLPTTDPSSPGSATLKLLSTLAVMYEKHVGRFTPITTPLFDILSKVVIPTGDPLQPPVSLLINCLFAIPLPKNYTYSKESVERLVDLLEQCLKAYTKDHPKLDREMVPLMLTILRLSESSDKAAKAVLAEKIFPTEKDREEVLGRGTTLPHILLGHVTNPIAANFTQTTLSIYFELADRDPQVFVTTVGFGNAAGFLAAKGIKMSESDMKKSANSGPSFAINPITGQKLDMEDVSDVPEMTDEEKEREAERLFVLFERLRATGVVDIENPVTKAKHEGRFEELPDDYDEDADEKK